jgi:putative transposase
VDTLGNLLGVKVLPADIPDREAARDLLMDLANLLPRLRRLWADQGYSGDLVQWVQERFGWTLEIVSKLVAQIGFVVLPKRWVVERTIAWLCRNRRLAKDYEFWETTTEALIYLASLHLMLKRLTPLAAQAP